MVHFRIRTFPGAGEISSVGDRTILKISVGFGEGSGLRLAERADLATSPAPATRRHPQPPRGVLRRLGTPTREKKMIWGRETHSAPRKTGFPEPENLQIRASGLVGTATCPDHLSTFPKSRSGLEASPRCLLLQKIGGDPGEGGGVAENRSGSLPKSPKTTKPTGPGKLTSPGPAERPRPATRCLRALGGLPGC